MFCKNCGKENPEGTQFCSECGSRLGEEVIQSTVASSNKKGLWTYFAETIKKFYKLIIEGRARRSEYWGFVLFYLIFAFIAGIIDYLLLGEGDSTLVVDYYIGIFMLPYLSVGFRRMHDVGKPAGFIFIPIYGFILTLMDSEKGSNKYGASPKGV